MGVLAAICAGLRTQVAEHGSAAIMGALLACRSAIETHDLKGLGHPLHCLLHTPRSLDPYVEA
jgi:hypothetical protein